MHDTIHVVRRNLALRCRRQVWKTSPWGLVSDLRPAIMAILIVRTYYNIMAILIVRTYYNIAMDV